MLKFIYQHYKRDFELSDKEQIDIIKSKKGYCPMSSYPGIKIKSYVVYDFKLHKVWKISKWLPIFSTFKDYFIMYPANRASYLRKKHNVPRNDFSAYMNDGNALYKKYHVVTAFFSFYTAIRILKLNS